MTDRQVSLYRYVTLVVAGFVIGLEEQELLSQEQILVDNLFSDDVYRSAMAMDVLMCLARAEKTYRNSLFKLFVKFAADPECDDDQKVKLRVLLKRIIRKCYTTDETRAVLGSIVEEEEIKTCIEEAGLCFLFDFSDETEQFGKMTEMLSKFKATRDLQKLESASYLLSKINLKPAEHVIAEDISSHVMCYVLEKDVFQKLVHSQQQSLLNSCVNIASYVAVSTILDIVTSAHLKPFVQFKLTLIRQAVFNIARDEEHGQQVFIVSFEIVRDEFNFTNLYAWIDFVENYARLTTDVKFVKGFFSFAHKDNPIDGLRSVFQTYMTRPIYDSDKEALEMIKEFKNDNAATVTCKDVDFAKLAEQVQKFSENELVDLTSDDPPPPQASSNHVAPTQCNSTDDSAMCNGHEVHPLQAILDDLSAKTDALAKVKKIDVCFKDNLLSIRDRIDKLILEHKLDQKVES